MLPATAPALPALTILVLTIGLIQDFPSSVAAALQRLQTLDLSHMKFEGISAALSQITTLKKVDLSYNDELQLKSSDVTTLAALAHSSELCLERFVDQGTDRWYDTSEEVLIAIKESFPKLHLPGL